MSTLRITDRDENFLAAYLWWEVDVTDIKGRTDLFPPDKKAVLKKLTQKPFGRDCF